MQAAAYYWTLVLASAPTTKYEKLTGYAARTELRSEKLTPCVESADIRPTLFSFLFLPGHRERGEERLILC